jgi:hypothetical protein
VDGDPDQDVFMCDLGIFDKHIKVAVLIEYAGVHQFVFPCRFVPATVFFHQAIIGKSPLRVFVEKFHVGMGGGGIQIKIIFLDVFGMVALDAGQSEKAFLENRILSVP